MIKSYPNKFLDVSKSKKEKASGASLLRSNTGKKIISSFLFCIVVLLAAILPNKLFAQTTNFSYTGGTQSFTVPCGVTSIVVKCWGAGGGAGGDGGSNSKAGGSGGGGAYATATYAVSPADVLTVVVGGHGGNGCCGGACVGAGGSGYGNATHAGGGGGAATASQAGAGGGGGGASYVLNSTTSTTLAIAGGGGGGGGSVSSVGGAGGGGGVNGSNSGGAGGSGNTGTGIGANGGASGTNGGGGGGGGGALGGNGGVNNGTGGGGGAGGSSSTNAGTANTITNGAGTVPGNAGGAAGNATGGTINSTCTSVNGKDGYVVITWTVVSPPAAPTGSASQSFCSSSSPTVASLTATGTAIQWYAASSGGTALATSTALVTATHYYATQTVSGCESTTRFDVTVTITTAPATLSAITGTVQQCPGAVTQAYSITAVAGGPTYTWTVPTGWTQAGGATNSMTVSTVGTAGQNGNVSVYAVVGACTTPTRILEVSSTLPPTPASITGTTSVCIGSTTTLASTPPAGGTTSGGYRTHTFTGNGNFITPAGFSGNIEVLAVAGGGGGGGNGGGGGGAGGLVHNASQAVAANTTYAITIGTGGAAGANANAGFVGSNTTFGALITANGGGRGGSYNNPNGSNTAGAGGSGGGAAGEFTAGLSVAGTNTAGQGNSGGSGQNPTIGCNTGAGGGGGADKAGTTGATGAGGAGGAGLAYAISGSSVYYAGGGGGGVVCASGSVGAAGNGGGGAGSTGAGNNGTANTGGGGGGTGIGDGTLAGAGGSGIVIVRYPDAAGVWASSNTAVATVSAGGVVTGVAAGSCTITYSVTAGGCSSGQSATVTVSAVPSAVSATPNTNPICSGSSLSMTGAATNATSYSWTGPNGFTSTSLSPGVVNASVTTAMAGNYSITATSPCGSTISGVAETVNALPTITVQPVAPAAFCAGSGSGTISVTATGTGLTYQWRLAGSNIANNATYSGVTGATLTITNPAVAAAGNYDAVVTGTAPCTSVTSSAVAVMVNALPAITGQPVSYLVDPTATPATPNGIFTVTATGAGLSYQWEESTDGGATFAAVPVNATYTNGTTATLTIVTPASTKNGNYYRCKVSGTCTPFVYSNGLALLTVNTAGIQYPCAGYSQNYNINPATADHYRWTFPTGWVQISGDSTSSIYVNPSTTSGNITVTPVNCSGAGTAFTFSVTVAYVTIAASTSNSICAGTNVTFTATPFHGGTTPTYQWTKNGVNVGTNSTTYSDATLAEGDAIAVNMISNNATNNCSYISTPIFMHITPYAVISLTSVPGTNNQNLCSGNTIVPVTYTLTGSGTGASVSPALPTGITGSYSNGVYTISGTPTTGQALTVYTLTATGTCTGVASTATFSLTIGTSVSPSVSIAATATAICNGTGVTFTATPSGGGTPVYQWKNGGALVGTNSYTYAATTLSNNDAITVLMTTSLGCATPWQSTSNTITMSVNSPINNNVISTAQVICTGSTPAGLTGTTPGGGNGSPSAHWQWSTTSSTAGFVLFGGIQSLTTRSLTGGNIPTVTTWYRRYITSGVCATDTSAVIAITVNTAITNNIISATQSICSGATPSPLAGGLPAGGNGAYTYAWVSSTTSSTAGWGGTIATTPDYSPGALGANTWYQRTVTSAPCPPTTSPAIGTFSITPLNPSVTIAASPSGAICAGTSVVFTPTPTNAGTTPSYQWQKAGVNIAGEIYSNYTTSTLANNDKVSVVMTPDVDVPACASVAAVNSNTITATVNVIPLATVTNSGQTICSTGGFATMALSTSNGVAGTTYAWTRDNTVGVTGIAASGTGDITGVVLTNSTSSAITVTFTIIPTGPTGTFCAGPAITATIVVNPAAPAAPGAISGIVTTYAGFVEPYSIAPVTNATTYTWTVPAGWGAITGQGTTSISVPAGVAGSNGNITVTASSGCSTSTASILAVTVLANIAPNTTPCQGTTQVYTTQNRTAVSYQWSVPSDWTITGGGNSNSITVTAGAVAGNVQVIEYNSCGDGTARTLALNPNPRPAVTTTVGYACSGTALNIPLASTPAAASTYAWIAADNASTTGESLTTQSGATINNTITINTGAITTVTYSVIPTVTATGCVGTDGGMSPQIVTATINPSGYWTGLANPDRSWFTVGNWCGIPSCTADAFIPTTPPGAQFPQIGAAGAVCRDLTISTGASLEYLTTYGLNVCGNWLNNGAFTPASGTTTFQGTTNTSIGGIAENFFYSVTMNKTGGSGSNNDTLTQPATITNTLKLTNGIIISSTSNLLTLTSTASSDSGNVGSFVSGPMRWNGLHGVGPYVFPTGKGTKWARIGIKNLDTICDFQAEYYNTSAAKVTPAYMAATPSPVLKKVSAVERWDFFRVSPVNTVHGGKLTLWWQDAGWSGISNCNTLKIAHWDPSNATNAGGTMGSWEDNNPRVTTTGSCGGSSSGSITSNTLVTEFSPFTFGDTTNTNPLPIELLYFNATYNGSTVDATWQTASEINNDYFTVERSLDGIHFFAVGVIVPSKAKGGNSTSDLSYYLNDDNVTPGVYYYRLKQTDFNGEFKYSNIAVVEIKGNADFSFNISPNPSDGTALNSIITAEKGQEVVIVVYDVLGQELYSKIVVTEQKGNAVYAIDLLQKLSKGVYMITATSNQKIYCKRLIVN